MSHHQNQYLAGTPAGGSSAFQSIPWGAAPRHDPAGYPATASLGYMDHNEQQSVAPNDVAYSWRMHSNILKQVMKNLAYQVDSEVVAIHKERHGPNRSRVVIVVETPDSNEI